MCAKFSASGAGTHSVAGVGEGQDRKAVQPPRQDLVERARSEREAMDKDRRELAGHGDDVLGPES